MPRGTGSANFGNSARLLASALAAVLCALGPAAAGEPFAPSWIESDAVNRRVRIDLVAGWNGNNIHRWNFNGYYKGNLTVMVPAEWTVTIDFHNVEEGFEHSLVLARPYPQLEMPLRLTAADAIDGVHTLDPLKGIASGKSESIGFVAKPGAYFLASGALVQMVQGLYIRLDVAHGLDRAAAVFNRRVPATGDEPYRP